MLRAGQNPGGSKHLKTLSSTEIELCTLIRKSKRFHQSTRCCLVLDPALLCGRVLHFLFFIFFFHCFVGYDITQALTEIKRMRSLSQFNNTDGQWNSFSSAHGTCCLTMKYFLFLLITYQIVVEDCFSANYSARLLQMNVSHCMKHNSGIQGRKRKRKRKIREI